MTRDSRFRWGALLSAALLSLMATVCWSQQPSLTWLGTLGGFWSEARINP